MTWWRRDAWGMEWWVRPRWLILLALIGWAAISYRIDPEWGAGSDGDDRLPCFLWLAFLIVVVGSILEAFTTTKKDHRRGAPQTGPAREGATVGSGPGADKSPTRCGMIDFKCSHCGAAMSSPDSRAGLTDTCPACDHRTGVPSGESPPSPPLSPVEQQAPEEVLYSARPSHWGYVWHYFLGAMIAAGGVALLALADPREASAYPWCVGVILFGLAMVAWAYLDRAVTRFEVTTRTVSVKKGILTRVVAEIPTRWVREIRMKQGPIGRMVNVGKLGFWSSASRDVEIVYRGVRDPDSLRKLVREYSLV